jgi:hypothetical protein
MIDGVGGLLAGLWPSIKAVKAIPVPLAPPQTADYSRAQPRDLRYFLTKTKA